MDGLSIKSIKKNNDIQSNSFRSRIEILHEFFKVKMAILFLFCFIIIFVYYFKRNQENLQNK